MFTRFVALGGLLLSVSTLAAPTVVLTAPIANSTHAAPATLALQAQVEPEAGRAIARVAFYANGAPVGETDTPPYRVSWSGVGLGFYNLYAIATDELGATAASPLVPVTVVWAPAPDIAISEPLTDVVFTAPAVITVKADVRPDHVAAGRMDFYANGVPIGSASVPPFHIVWENVPAGVYQLSAIVTDTYGSARASAAVQVIVAVPPTAVPVVAISSPADNAVFARHAPIPLSATASDSDGSIAMVEFLQGTVSLATVTQAPYAFTWTDATPGTYAIMARAVDNLGATTYSAPVAVTVQEAGQVYYIHPDHLNTPRAITDEANNVVWRWDSDAFGSAPPDEDPGATGVLFVFNPRFPGQYFDAETGLHYNYRRDYDPGTGRYMQSDPIGLEGGINTYAYVDGDPLSYVDPDGLQRQQRELPRRVQEHNDRADPHAQMRDEFARKALSDPYAPLPRIAQRPKPRCRMVCPSDRPASCTPDDVKPGFPKLSATGEVCKSICEMGPVFEAVPPKKPGQGQAGGSDWFKSAKDGVDALDFARSVKGVK